MLFLFTILLMTDQIGGFEIREEEELRNCIYNRKPKFGGIEGFGGLSTNFIIVPKEIEELFKKKPAQTLGVLVSIVEGANPKESCLAAAYAITLMKNEGFSGFIIYNDLFGENEYDKLKPNEKYTWRNHWIKSINFYASKKGINLKPKEPEK